MQYEGTAWDGGACVPCGCQSGDSLMPGNVVFLGLGCVPGGFGCFFFFQAEDGIRDHCVTGVQTCALPIYRVAVLKDGVLQQLDTPQALFSSPANLFVAAFIGSPSMNLVEAEVDARTVSFGGFRSEERRVGKERRSRRRQCHVIKTGAAVRH